MNTVPIIRIEVERMKHTLMVMLSEHAAQLDADMLAAVESFCQPEHLARIVRDAAHAAMKSAIEAEVKEFFSYGEGRKAVAAAVKEALLKKESYTPLDEVP